MTYKEHGHEVDVSRSRGVRGQSRRPVPKEPVDGGADDRYGDLGDGLRGAESEPAVDPRWQLSRFPEGSILIEFGHHGIYNGWRDDDDQEAREHSITVSSWLLRMWFYGALTCLAYL